MAELQGLGPQDFSRFFDAIHGVVPFPWQARLAARLAEGDWPAVLDLPTATGKTAAIDAAVFRLALEAGSATRRAPLRILYVVDRRTIVDQAYRRARKIADAIARAQTGVLAAVRERLCSYTDGGSPLAVTALRGAIARSDTWARSPDQPLVAVSTVDQVGSRLLFRGYGVSPTMRPIHAGLLGNDVLYLLDEVHLSEPFRQTLEAVQGRYAGWAERPLPARFSVVEMSATPGRVCSEVFGLEEEDRAPDAPLAARLRNPKPATLCCVPNRGFAAEVEKAVRPLAELPGATVAVVVNRVAVARELRERLGAALKGADVHLLTGRMRPCDRERVERALFPRLQSERVRDGAQRPVVVVATQCIEAGADFDFDALVTECASLDALRQRFGRLNRIGQLPSAPGVIIAREGTLKGDPVYGTALGATWAWLQQVAQQPAASASSEGEALEPVVDFASESLRVPASACELLAPRVDAPVLLPGHLDAWAQTSPEPTPEPEVALWLHGPQRGLADVQVIWRSDLSADLLELTAEEGEVGAKATHLALTVVDALPPASGEAMAVPFAAVKRWLAGRPEPEISDVEGAQDETDESPGAGERDQLREPRRALLWQGEDSRGIGARDLRPGQTIVVPSTYGGIAQGTWSPAAETPVKDRAELAAFRQRGRAVLRLHPLTLADWFGERAAGAPLPSVSELGSDAKLDREAVAGWLLACEMPDELLPIVTQLRREGARARVDRIEGFASLDGSDAQGGLRTEPYFVVTARRRVSFEGGEVTTEDDRASFTGEEVRLVDHLRHVAERASGFAARIGLPAEVAGDVTLAARWHDAGKADDRFQRLLHGGSEYKTLVAKDKLAKSATALADRGARARARELSGYPSGTRHEVMAVSLLAASAEPIAAAATDWDLVLHLIGSHHGFCRPLAPWAQDSAPVEVSWRHEGILLQGSSAHGLERLDSGVGDRFWRLLRRYGWWGLSWLETVLRLGDHRASEAEQRREALP